MESRGKRLVALCNNNIASEPREKAVQEPTELGVDDNVFTELQPIPGCSYQNNVEYNLSIQSASDDDESGCSSEEYQPPTSNNADDDDSCSSDNANSNKFNNAADAGSLVKNAEVKEIVHKKRKNIKAWKKNIRKKRRLNGEEYLGFRNIKHPARPLLPSPCIDKLKHKCNSTVNENHRLEIWTKYRNLPTIDDQRQFLVNHIDQKPKKRTTRNLESSRKKYTNYYSFTVNGDRKAVCREFFMATLNITDAFIRCSLKKRTSTGILEKDQRGKHVPCNKLVAEDDAFLRNHITSFPAMESHYCRKKSTKKYLDTSLNITIMHRMYTDLCIANNRKPVSLEKYRLVFKEYNLGFFKPKKDQCKKCLAQRSRSEEEQQQYEVEFNLHLQKKESARQSRDEDKEMAQLDPSVLSFNFDLQAVLCTPKGKAGQIFYLRKLAVYNLTIYNLGNRDVQCYLWDETQGKRGSNEISSCVYTYILSHSNITTVRMMSDGCGGQQKNSIFAGMCLDLVIKHPTLQSIDHKFFETGHTEMECDSIHSKIEQKSKHVPVYTPEGWAQVIRDSRRNPAPFGVTTMIYDDFYDFKDLSSNTVPQNVPWRRVCWLRYEKNNPTKIFYKTTFQDEQFIEITLKPSRGRPKKESSLKKAYTQELPIAEIKFKNLQTMCSDLTIPKAYHNFYKSLKTDKKIKDILPQPDAEEESESESE